jgi:hypothetical protein
VGKGQVGVPSLGHEFVCPHRGICLSTPSINLISLSDLHARVKESDALHWLAQITGDGN